MGFLKVQCVQVHVVVPATDCAVTGDNPADTVWPPRTVNLEASSIAFTEPAISNAVFDSAYRPS